MHTGNQGHFLRTRAVNTHTKNLEEERRLCYVGMTRAMQKLYLTHAESRRLYGNEVFHAPSRFIHEMPAELIQEIRHQRVVKPISSHSSNTRNTYRQSPRAASAPTGKYINQMGEQAGDTGFKLGQRVTHATFGEGIILNYEGHSAHARIQVKFNNQNIKWLVASYANLQPAAS